MNFGKTIQIFLPDGNPRSIKLAEITSSTLLAIQIPRAKLNEAGKRQELKRCSVYFLIGASEEDSKTNIYVGEAEDALKRLKQHNKSKDFWVSAIAIISKTHHLTKTHIKYLEWLSYCEAKGASRYAVENSTIPNQPYVSEPMEADLRDNFETIKLLLSTLGHPVFDKIIKPKKKQLIYCTGKDASAIGEYTEDGLIIFSGSKCNFKMARSAKSYVRNARQKLIEDKILVEVENAYEFSTNHVFSSPSRAAAVVLAREANGWIEWKYEDGKTLDEAHRQIENAE